MSSPNNNPDQNFTLLEKRESQLWWLAVFVIVMLASALSAVDWSSSIQLESDHPLAVALNTKAMRIALILSVLATSAYFRDSAKRLRRTNNLLIADLQEQSEDLQRKNVEASKLKDMSEELIGLTDLKRALDLALDMAVDVIGADTASIMLLEGDSDTLRVVAARGLPDEVVREAKVRLGDALSGMVAESGESLIINSDILDGELKDRAHRIDELVSSIIVPVRIESEVRGVINISKRRGGSCFSEDDMRVLSTLANQTSLVLQKLKLWEDLQKQVVKLEQALLELKETHNELIQSEKLASIGQFAGGIAHEINNPLQVIQGHIELIMRKVEDESEEARRLQIVLRHIERISSIVSSLLRFARRQPDEGSEPVLIDEVVKDAVKLLENQLSVDDISLKLDLNCNGGVVTGSRVKLQQVFMNLVLNAYQAMQQTGGELRVQSTLDTNEAIITVTDTGPGISPEHLPHIFEPFFTTKAEGKGTGLGLSVTYGIVEALGGRIEAESEVGRGATFTIALPLGESVSRAA